MNNNMFQSFTDRLRTQPKALSVLFFTELWERFSYYGMRGILVLYMTKALMYDDAEAVSIFAAYNALVYIGPVLGGLLAERLLGYSYSIIIGSVLMAIGHLSMAIPDEQFFFFALAFIALGSGFFKPNMTSTLGKLYENEYDPRRDTGFQIFYMGINMGAFFQFVCGALAESPAFGWHYGFSIAGVGMIIGLWVYLRNRKLLNGKGDAPDPEYLLKPLFGPINRLHLVVVSALVMIPTYVYIILHGDWLRYVLLSVAAVAVAYLLFEAFKRPKQERERIFAAIVMTGFAVLFFTFFEQAGSSMSLFTDRNVDRSIGDGVIPTSIFQSVNPFFIVILTFPFIAFWQWLETKKLDISIPAKFGWGMILLGLGFYAMVLGAGFAGPQALVPVFFLILAYFMHTTGELFMSPIGLSMVTKLSPNKLTGIMMGVWLLSSALAHSLGAIVAKMAAIPDVEKGTAQLTAVQTLPIYTEVFNWVGMVACGCGVVILAISPLINRWMHGVK